MSSKKAIAAGVQDVWSKLNNRWKGEDANAFHRQYIVKITETAESFEDACAELGSISSELSKELQMIEQSLVN